MQLSTAAIRTGKTTTAGSVVRSRILGHGITVTHADQIRPPLDEAHRLGGPVVVDA
ncbi:MAG: hypothetical protein R3D27_10295 [Hyphomicrobiaceae bacterium]